MYCWSNETLFFAASKRIPGHDIYPGRYHRSMIFTIDNRGINSRRLDASFDPYRPSIGPCILATWDLN